MQRMEEQLETVLNLVVNGQSQVGEGWKLVNSCTVKQVPSSSANQPPQKKFTALGRKLCLGGHHS